MRVGAGEIGFSDHSQPVLEPGGYDIAISQDMSIGSDSEKIPESKHRVFVDGHRFSIPPDDIYSVFPAPTSPPGHEGTQPNVVFSRTTIPWERRLDFKPIKTTQPVEPWLCVIVLCATDFEGVTPASPVSGKVDSLVNPGPGIRGPKNIKLDGVETAESPCQWVDLETAFARKLLPRRSDLPWLAHVREVATDHKETWSHLTDGKFSVVCSNRIPPAAPPNTEANEVLCLLVSLEGQEAVLNADTAIAEKTVRLAVLGNWRYAVGPHDPFRAAIINLDPETEQQSALLRPQLPAPTAQAGAQQQFEQLLATGTQHGFTLLRHRTRVGAETASWYRSPLIPRETPADTNNDVIIDVSNADQMLTFDPANGLFDTTYAAAWQVGRLVALQNAPAASAIRRFRRTVDSLLANAAHNRALREEILSRQKNTALSYLFVDPPEIISNEEFEKKLHIPEEIFTFASRLALLYEVPLEYLLPHDSLLPENAIRFFYLDRYWIATMMLGALSVGRMQSRATAADKIFWRAVVGELPKLVRTVRHGETEFEQPAPLIRDWKVTGFLLRSPAVGAWLGLESQVTGIPQGSASTNAVPLKPLRIDRLQPDLLLCLFDGHIAELSIRQPQEALHFGLTVKEPGQFQKELRGPPSNPTAEVTGHVDFTTRSMSAEGVVDFAALAKAIGEKTGESMTPAIMAHYMISSPLHFVIGDLPLAGAIT